MKIILSIIIMTMTYKFDSGQQIISFWKFDNNNYYYIINAINPSNVTTSSDTLIFSMDSCNNLKINDNIIYFQSDVQADFVGGENKLKQYIRDNLIIPNVQNENCNSVFISFIIDKTGRISFIGVNYSCNYLYSLSAIKLIQDMPLWSPAYINKEAVYSFYSLIIKFGL